MTTHRPDLYSKYVLRAADAFAQRDLRRLSDDQLFAYGRTLGLHAHEGGLQRSHLRGVCAVCRDNQAASAAQRQGAREGAGQP